MAATLVSVVFWVTLLRRHRLRPRPATFAWLVGLGCYAVGVGCQALAELGGLTELVYRLWYLAGAFFTAAYLGMGSIYLAGPRWAPWAMRGLAWASALVIPVVMTAPLDVANVDPHLLSGAGFPDYVRLLTPAFNLFGTAGLVGVAAWSALRRSAGRPFWPPALIAAGSFVTASGATLLRFGVPGGFYVSQLVGIVLMWLGFAIPSRVRARG
ncbi:MAG TPA: hypothetical protein VFC93_12785 [Chloroflexota bacterium]|nr:hypothetical protein [Chloroflexota bacterium]